jgi:hypothetical protein
MNLLPIIKIDNFLTNLEILSIEKNICNHIHTRTIPYYLDNKLTSNSIFWDYYGLTEVFNILDNPLKKLLKISFKVQSARILDSRNPYKLHTDYNHSGDQTVPAYTIIIPLEDYDSQTIVFNEFMEMTNEFEDYKKVNSPFENLQLDPKFCAKRLSHLHPSDLKYLSLLDTFDWKKGSMFAMDRRNFHCSDNYKKQNLNFKRGIVIWTNFD